MRGFIAATLLAICAITPAVAQGTGGTLGKIANSGTIVLGHRHSSPPFSFLDKDEQPIGLSIDLCLRVVDAVKQQLARPDLIVKFVPVDADDRLQKVADGSIDIECGNTTNTLTRQEQVDFTNTIFITGASLLLPAASAVQGVGDLTGKKVAVVEGTTTEKALRERLAAQSVEARVIPVADHDKAMKMLAKGEVDAHAGDQIVLIGLAHSADDPSKFVVAPNYSPMSPTLWWYGATMRIFGWSPIGHWRSFSAPVRSCRCSTSGLPPGAVARAVFCLPSMHSTAFLNKVRVSCCLLGRPSK